MYNIVLKPDPEKEREQREGNDNICWGSWGQNIGDTKWGMCSPCNSRGFREYRSAGIFMAIRFFSNGTKMCKTGPPGFRRRRQEGFWGSTTIQTWLPRDTGTQVKSCCHGNQPRIPAHHSQNATLLMADNIKLTDCGYWRKWEVSTLLKKNDKL